MYIFLFGIESLRMYDLIGALGLLFIVFFFLNPKTWQRDLGAVAKEHVAAYTDREKPSFLGKPRFWTALGIVLPMVVHLVFYTLGGERFAALTLVGRATEFFGYILLSAVGMVLAAGMLGYSPLDWLDRTVPLYLVMASVLKSCCFCAGCCNGHPWAFGFYNQRTGQTEFPIQLVEMGMYALLLWALSGYRGRPGSRFALFLTAYAGVRFAVQFFRADQPLFSTFHWMSVVFLVVGLVSMALVHKMPQKAISPQEEEKEP